MIDMMSTALEDPEGPGGAVIRTCTISADGSSSTHGGRGSEKENLEREGVDVLKGMSGFDDLHVEV
jgi:hypothetical protein